jgi:hypothetical protein
MNIEYWPWWMGGLALAGLTILFRLVTSKPLGVSGSWYQVAYWKEQKAKAESIKNLSQNKDAATDALMAAALAEFGDAEIEDTLGSSVSGMTNENAPSPVAARNIPWTAHLVFLICMATGGFLWAMYTGNFHIQMQLSDLHTQLSGTGWKLAFVLFIGGTFVGIGTQMAGGCSSGHGLSGCSNFSVASFIATAFFFGTAVIVCMSFKMVFLS